MTTQKSSSGLPAGMNDKLLNGFADALGKIVAEQKREWAKEVERIEAEKRAFIAELKAENAAQRSDLRELAETLESRVAEALAKVKDGAPGKDGEPGPAGPTGEAGPKGDTGPQGDRGDKGQPGEVGTVGPAGPQGAAGEAGAAGERGERGEKGEPGIAGKDGASILALVIDRDGHLQATLGDGQTRDLGLIVGKDGAAGVDGKAGIDGAAGRDGLGFDDLDVVETDDGVFLRFTRGDAVKDFRLPIIRECGIYKEGQTYRRGDGVTWAGSFWIAQDETKEKPDSGKGWRLAVKRGRDGKDGVMKPAREPKPVKVGG